MLRLYIAEDEIPDADLAALATKVMSVLETGPAAGLCLMLPTRLTDTDTQSFGTFAHADVTPLVAVTEHLFVLELFHGPTLGTLCVGGGTAISPQPTSHWPFLLQRGTAFKDVALQFLGNLFQYFLDRRPSLRPLTVLGATSGDTGSAAIHGLRGRAGIEIIVLHPRGRVSPVQELQMTSVLDANVHNVAVDGTFDDCQVRRGGPQRGTFAS